MFFVKQKTSYEMRISDGSSDVCSSDLEHRVLEHPLEQFARFQEAIERRQRAHFGLRDAAQDVLGPQLAWMLQPSRAQQVAQRLDSVLVELEHASCRERVCQYV